MWNSWVRIPWKTWLTMKKLKDERFKNKLKWHACDFYITLGLGVVQMVRNFKTSWSIRVIAPLNGHFKSKLRWHVQNQRHIKRTVCTFICSGGKNRHSFSATQWTFHIEYVTKRTWHYVFLVLQKSSLRYVIVMRSDSVYVLRHPLECHFLVNTCVTVSGN